MLSEKKPAIKDYILHDCLCGTYPGKLNLWESRSADTWGRGRGLRVPAEGVLTLLLGQIGIF